MGKHGQCLKVCCAVCRSATLGNSWALWRPPIDFFSHNYQACPLLVLSVIEALMQAVLHTVVGLQLAMATHLPAATLPHKMVPSFDVSVHTYVCTLMLMQTACLPPALNTHRQMVDKCEFERQFWECYDLLHAAATPEVGVPGYFRFMTLLCESLAVCAS